MDNVISKSKFKPNALKYFRLVERTGREIIITDHGRPAVRIVPFTDDPLEGLKALRNTVLKYVDPTDPVGVDDWESNR